MTDQVSQSSVPVKEHPYSSSSSFLSNEPYRWVQPLVALEEFVGVINDIYAQTGSRRTPSITDEALQELLLWDAASASDVLNFEHFVAGDEQQ